MSDESGSLQMSLVAEGSLSRAMLESKDGKNFSVSIATCYNRIDGNFSIVFIVDSGKEVFVWIGSGASADEKKNAMTYAHVRKGDYC